MERLVSIIVMLIALAALYGQRNYKEPRAYAAAVYTVQPLVRYEATFEDRFYGIEAEAGIF